MARIIIIMGVSGSGKTTIGKHLANHLQLPFFDADHFHPKTNIEKMKQNMALDDTDRRPWLDALAILIKEWSTSNGAVLACSALKESYREILATYTKAIDWIFLSGSFKTIMERIEQRQEHFMKSSLLQSQFDTLEIPSYGFHIDIEQGYENTISEIIEKLSLNEKD
ncbi:gluconokinase [Winogradskyella sp.]|uniref:gluconokinase n=1 Tax=Winogradskyella sp. TaxID=1883156 RepID=UPI003BAADE12